MTIQYKWLFAALCITFLSGCQTLNESNEKPIPPRDPALEGVDLLDVGSTDKLLKEYPKPPSAEEQKRRYEVYPGTGDYTHDNKGLNSQIISSKDGVELHFENTDIREVAKTILGDILKLNYTIEPGLKGLVTFNTSAPVAKDSLLLLLEVLLNTNRAVLVEYPKGLYRVAPRGTIAGSKPAVTVGKDLKPGYRLQVVPLQYVTAPVMADILKPIAPKDAFVRIDPVRNILILAGTGVELSNLLETIQVFDANALKGQSVAIIGLQYSDADVIVAQLQGIFSPEAKSPLAGMLRMLPLPQLNSLMLISSKEHYLREAKVWIERLDRVDGTTGGNNRSLYVYPVQNGRAERLAKLLTQLFDVDSGNTGTGAKQSSLAPGKKPINLSSGATPATSAVTAVAKRAAASKTKKSASGNKNSPVKVVADEENNALIIMASPVDYYKIEDALLKLDIAPLQVLIEATIMEVTLTNDFELGLEWTFNGGIGGNSTGVGLLDLGAAGIGAKTPGFSYSVVGPAANIKATLNALAKDSLLKVLSSPSILVLDNHSASIRVGDQQPVKTGTTVTDGGNTTEQIEYKDTGVLLEVKPRVNASGLVTLELKQEVTDVGDKDAVTGQRSFLERKISSTVAVNSGGSIVLGGLIRDNSTDSSSGIPGLYDLPVIGNLFGTDTTESKRTELLIVITPRVMKDSEDALRIGEEMRRKMRGVTKAFQL